MGRGGCTLNPTINFCIRNSQWVPKQQLSPPPVFCELQLSCGILLHLSTVPMVMSYTCWACYARKMSVSSSYFHALYWHLYITPPCALDCAVLAAVRLDCNLCPIKYRINTSWNSMESFWTTSNYGGRFNEKKMGLVSVSSCETLVLHIIFTHYMPIIYLACWIEPDCTWFSHITVNSVLHTHCHWEWLKHLNDRLDIHKSGKCDFTTTDKTILIFNNHYTWFLKVV